MDYVRVKLCNIFFLKRKDYLWPLHQVMHIINSSLANCATFYLNILNMVHMQTHTYAYIYIYPYKRKHALFTYEHETEPTYHLEIDEAP